MEIFKVDYKSGEGTDEFIQRYMTSKDELTIYEDEYTINDYIDIKKNQAKVSNLFIYYALVKGKIAAYVIMYSLLKSINVCLLCSTKKGGVYKILLLDDIYNYIVEVGNFILQVDTKSRLLFADFFYKWKTPTFGSSTNEETFGKLYYSKNNKISKIPAMMFTSFKSIAALMHALAIDENEINTVKISDLQGFLLKKVDNYDGFSVIMELKIQHRRHIMTKIDIPFIYYYLRSDLFTFPKKIFSK
jgi:hypothetical protein